MPLQPSELATLQPLIELWGSDHVLVIGAAALRHHLGMSWRTTQDLDLAVAPSPRSYQKALLDLGWTQDARIPHAWRTQRGVRVDIIPVDSNQPQPGRLEWRGQDRTMNLTGLRCAFETALEINLDGEAVAKIASLASLGLLKMSAFLDRPGDREQDLHDLGFLLARYLEHDEARNFRLAAASPETDHQLLPAFAFGLDLARTVDPKERELVMEFLSQGLDESHPATILPRMARATDPAWSGDPNRLRLGWLSFRTGFEYPRS